MNERWAREIVAPVRPAVALPAIKDGVFYAGKEQVTSLA